VPAGSLEVVHPALPDQPGDDAEWLSADDVGDFEQGSPLSRWALARYLVGRAIGESVGSTLLIVALVLLAVAALGQWVIHSTLLAVLLGILGIGVLLIRWVLLAVLRRLTEADGYGPLEARLRALVSDTRGDVLRELRRVGLPSHTFTLPILAVRLIGKRRKETFARLRGFDISRAVPKARLDELHMLLSGR
jgi:hypothetical protein